MERGPFFFGDVRSGPPTGRRAYLRHRAFTSARGRRKASLQDAGVKPDSLSEPPAKSILFIDGPVVLG